MVTDQQVVLLRQRRMEGKTQQTSAAMAGMSVRSVHKWQREPLPSETGQERWWRTRTDPFGGVWEEEIEPLLQGEAAGRLRATTIIEWLEERYPGRFSASQLRTMQRRLQDWRALNGPDQEVYFPQEHPPGREAQTDFTHCNSLGVTIGGRPYRHLLFQLVLSHSGWRYAEVVARETFLALKQGLQNALWELGGVPQVIRSDNTSALTHEMKRSRGRALNDAYGELLDHYGLRSTLINSGESHENGVAEQAHYRLKDALDQALMLRGSRDFDTADDYRGFVRKVVDRRNRLVWGKLEQERPHLQPLPPAPVPEYVNYRARVRKWSTIQELAAPTPYPPACSSQDRRNRLVWGKLEQERPHLQPLPPAPVPEYVNYRARVRKWSTIQELAAPTPYPPASSGRRCRSGCTPNTWKCTTRTTWWNGWNVYAASGRPASTTGTSLARWCASPGPSPGTGSGSRCFPP